MFQRSLRLLPRPGFSFSLAGRVPYRPIQQKASDVAFDQDKFDEARSWYASFRLEGIPKGDSSYSRSSGPGGQHVNKTESKATTVWPLEKLAKNGFPKLMLEGLRASKYYNVRSDTIMLQAQTQRNRSANAEENHEKFFEELKKLYRELVPGETSEKKLKRFEKLEREFNAKRLRDKKLQSSKKASRKSSYSD